jgi:hypothetical protein
LGVSTTVALVFAGPEEQSPAPIVGIAALETVSVPVASLYEPTTGSAALGAAVITQPGRSVDVNVAPAFGMVRVNVNGVVLFSVSVHLPFVLLSVMVSVPPKSSEQPVIFGGLVRVTLYPAFAGTLPLDVKLVQVTTIGIPLISPLKVMSVPFFSFAETFVPAGSDLDAE